MKINVEGSKFRDAFAIPPEALIIPGLDVNPLTGEIDLVRPYMRKRLKAPIKEEFLESIRTYGVIQPVVLKQLSKEVYKVLAGSRRVRGSRIVNEQNAKEGLPPILVTCVIRTNTDDAFDVGLMVTENENREAVDHDAKVEEAWTLIHVNNMDEQDVAIMMGVTKSTLRSWLKDKTFSTEIKAELAAKTMDRTTARAIASLPAEKQKPVLEAAKKVAAEKKGTRKHHVAVRDVIKAVERINTGFTAPTKPEMLAVMRDGIPEMAMEVLLWTTGQGPLPAFLEAPGAAVPAEFDEKETGAAEVQQ